MTCTGIALALLVCSAPFSSSAAQGIAPADTCSAPDVTVAGLLKEAVDRLNDDRTAQAEACFRRAIDLATSTKDQASETAARLGAGGAAFNQGRYADAEEQARRARRLAEETAREVDVARADKLLGSVALFNNDRAGARRLYEGALDVFRRREVYPERIETMIALTKGAGLTREEANAILAEALPLARARGLRVQEARILHARGDGRFSEGQFDAAARDLAAAISLYREARRRANLADAYVSMGRVHRAHGQPDQAVTLYEEAGRIQEEIGDIRGLVQSTNAKAVALGILGRTREARAANERALELARRTGSARLINFQQGNLAASYADEGDYETAIRLLEEVIPRETDGYLLAYRHGALATHYSAIGRYDEALPHADQAVTFAETSKNRDYLIYLFLRRASILRALRRTAEALADARRGTEIVEEIRSRLVPLDFMKRGFAASNQNIFGLTIALMHDLGRDEQSLVLGEQARARAFLDLLASREMVPREGAEPSPAPPAASPAAIPRTEIPLASYAAAAPAAAGEIAAIAKRLRSTLVSYWVNDGELFIWVTDGERVRRARVPLKRADLEQTVKAAAPQVDRSDNASLERLYSWLIEPVATFLPPEGSVLTIVPHGPLSRVSFATLRDPSSRTYLVERYAISYAPSISSFLYTGRRVGAPLGPASTALLVANPDPMPRAEGERPLPPLPASAKEVKAIRAFFAAGRSTVLNGGEATEAAVLEHAAGKQVVHFATHGVFRDDEPLDSFMALSASEGDGRLTIRDLYAVKLEADLVALSACRTAAGGSPGDGIAGLSRALFYGGAASVLATLWEVADQPSADLMARFYAEWRRLGDKRRALRAAQLAMIGDLRTGALTVRTRHGVVRLREQPFYWGAFVLFGEP